MAKVRSKQATEDKNLDAQLAKIVGRIEDLEAFKAEIEGVMAANVMVLVGAKRETAELAAAAQAEAELAAAEAEEPAA